MSETISSSCEEEELRGKRMRSVSDTSCSSRKGKKLRNWNQDDMEKALQAVRIQKVSASAAARDYGVPRKTLTDRLHGKVADKCRQGTPLKITEEQEKDLCNYIEYMAGRGFPLTINQIIMYAWSIDKAPAGKHAFKSKGHSYQWWLSFKARHPHIARVRKPSCLDRGRANFSTVNQLRSYFQLLKEVLTEHNFFTRPQDIWNCDETMIDLNKSSQKVIVPRRFRSSHSCQAGTTEHISVHCCVNAAGTAMPPFIIFKGAFPGGSYNKGGPDGALYGKEKTGFMDSTLFLKWLEKLFIPHAKPTKEKPVLLLLDSHASHCTPEVIVAAKENNVILLALAPHTTHICQPLDVSVYKSFKAHLGKIIKLGQCIRGNLWIAKKDVPRILKVPFEMSMSLHNIKEGFRKCGIFPFNPNAVDKTHLLRNQLIPIDDNDLSIPPAQPYKDAGIQTEPLSEEATHQTEHATLHDTASGTNSKRWKVNEGASTSKQENVNQEAHGANAEACVSESHAVIETLDSNEIPQTNELHVSGGSVSVSAKHPLVKAGIVSSELAEIFTPPEEVIPVGRKRPLRIKSTARVMTEEDIYDIKQQIKELNSKTEKKGVKGKKKAKPQKKQDDDDVLRYICGIECMEENDAVRKLWAGCDTCPNWSCPRCLSNNFDYKAEFMCLDCQEF